MKMILTDLRNGIRWQEKSLENNKLDCVHQISVYPNVRDQRFEGFGGAFTEAAAHSWQQLPQERRQAFLDCYFGKDGLRYTQGRVHIGSCDFSLGNYACKRSPDDVGFNTERDDGTLIPMILAAQKTAERPLSLLLSPWSPPPFMKTNNEMNNGGRLKPEYRADWAACMAKYAAHYKAAGCDVRRMTVQNEPAAVQTWDSCIYSGREEGEFAAQFLVPALEAEGCGDVKILVWDHNKEILVYRANDSMSAPDADKSISGFAMHWYTGDHFDALRAVRTLYPDKELWFTEGCVEYSRFDGMTPLQKAEMYAHDILGNLNGGANGSLDWNLLLDSKGGPNHAGNFCEAPVMLNDDGTNFTLMSEYYYIGQFSRCIYPGAVHLGASSWSGNVEITAFENPDNTQAAVLLNRTDDDLPASLTFDGQNGCCIILPAHSICTVFKE